jgi:hypothetical protein
MYKVPSNTIRNFFNCFTTQFNTHVRILTVQKRCQTYGRWIWILWFQISNIWLNIHTHTLTNTTTTSLPPGYSAFSGVTCGQTNPSKQMPRTSPTNNNTNSRNCTLPRSSGKLDWQWLLSLFCFNHTVLVYCDFSPSKGPINLICVDGWFHGCSTGSFRVQSCSSNSRWFLFIIARGLRTHYCDATQIVHIPNRVFFFTSVVL